MEARHGKRKPAMRALLAAPLSYTSESAVVNTGA
jgi:hypothetical protein